MRPAVKREYAGEGPDGLVALSHAEVPALERRHLRGSSAMLRDVDDEPAVAAGAGKDEHVDRQPASYPDADRRVPLEGSAPGDLAECREPSDIDDVRGMARGVRGRGREVADHHLEVRPAGQRDGLALSLRQHLPHVTDGVAGDPTTELEDEAVVAHVTSG